MIETIMNFVNKNLGAILFFLPSSPFTFFIDSMEKAEWLSFLNWLVPFSTFIVIGETWLAAVGIYYLWQVVLRWIKAVE